MRRVFICTLAILLLTTITAFSQQRDIPQYSVIGGYSYLAAPSLNLAFRGFNGDVARNVRPWLSIGFDFSTFSGHNTIVSSYLNSDTQTKLKTLLPRGVPLSVVTVPADMSLMTYQFGPQLNYRRMRKFTLFMRPALGLLHAKAQTNPAPATTKLVGSLLGGKLSSADNAVFYGVGGGATWEMHRNFGLRFSIDLARFDMFPDLLNGSRNAVRFSITTKYGFGKNILAR